MKRAILYIAIALVLLSLNGCAVINPVTKIVGGTVAVAGNVAVTAVKTAVKAAPAALPFVL